MPINNSGHPYYSYKSQRHQPVRPKYHLWLLYSVALLAAVACFYFYLQPIGPVAFKKKVLSTQVENKIQFSWPATSQAALGSLDQGVLIEKPNQTVKPTASTAKLITALTILKKKPLQLGEEGPTITLTQADVDIYNQYFAKDGSLVQVQPGEKLTQYQMLQGILLPSANNYADSLAIWAFGSLENYKRAAQQTVKEFDMKNTTVGSDASGFSPDTTSTAVDLTKLAVAAMKNDVIRQIVKQDHVDLPVAGTKQNTNWLLGADGVVGVKTGNTVEAGGVYVFASNYDIDPSHSTTIVGAVQGDQTVMTAMHQARLLLNQARPLFKVVKKIEKGQVIATYTTPWGDEINAIAAKDIDVVEWSGKPIQPTISLKELSPPVQKGSAIGVIKYGEQASDIVLQKTLDAPSWQWRILRNF